MADRDPVEAIWYGVGLGAMAARLALRPAEALYASIVRIRGYLYDRGILTSRSPAVPTLSIGNLTVGGTGKTPVAAWAAEELGRAGARPAIVLRGYGDDEPLVHRQLNPGAIVVTAADRVRGVMEARERGADIVVLDDAFQHRQIRRNADWVLVSADRWTGAQRLLPAGPWREPLRGARRASVLIVTRKAASPERAHEVRDAVKRAAPSTPVAIAYLAASGLRRADADETRRLADLHGQRVRLVAAIGDPRALIGQLAAAGAVVDARIFSDHHPYTDRDIAQLATGADADTTVVCTLKDAVKIAPRWPRAAPALWYVSQRVIIEDGLEHLSRSIRNLLDARSSDPEAAGGRRPSL